MLGLGLVGAIGLMVMLLVDWVGGCWWLWFELGLVFLLVGCWWVCWWGWCSFGGLGLGDLVCLVGLV